MIALLSPLQGYNNFTLSGFLYVGGYLSVRIISSLQGFL
jgi:hypothetical protein